MYLALRRGAAIDATRMQKLTSDYIRFRLATVWPHAGVIIYGKLHHVSGHGGLQRSDFTPERWDLIDVGGDDDAAWALFDKLVADGGGYDYVELLGFTWVRPFLRLAAKNKRISAWLAKNTYCYQLALWLISLIRPTFRVTPELLLWHAITHRRP